MQESLPEPERFAKLDDLVETIVALGRSEHEHWRGIVGRTWRPRS